MDQHLAGVLFLAVLAVLVLGIGMFSNVEKGRTVEFKSKTVVINCRAVFESNGIPVPGVMVYGRGSTITDSKGFCHLEAEGDGFVRLFVYTPNHVQRTVIVPIGPDENEINVVIPIT